MKKNVIFEVIGWYGTCAIILSYALLSLGYLESMSLTYQIMNLTGAVGIVCISIVKKLYQTQILNIIWAVIALVAIVKIVI